MEPVSPVIRGLELSEVVYAKDQPQYIPLPTLRSKTGRVTSRWRLTAEERARIAHGADILLTLHTFNQPLQPIVLTVCPNEDITMPQDIARGCGLL